MSNCKRLKIPNDICTIELGAGKQTTTKEFRTCRKELMLLHFNEKTEVVAIELISNDKPCQRMEKLN
jgi:hypothetical protein